MAENATPRARLAALTAENRELAERLRAPSLERSQSEIVAYIRGDADAEIEALRAERQTLANENAKMRARLKATRESADFRRVSLAKANAEFAALLSDFGAQSALRKRAQTLCERNAELIAKLTTKSESEYSSNRTIEN